MEIVLNAACMLPSVISMGQHIGYQDKCCDHRPRSQINATCTLTGCLRHEALFQSRFESRTFPSSTAFRSPRSFVFDLLSAHLSARYPSENRKERSSNRMHSAIWPFSRHQESIYPVVDHGPRNESCICIYLTPVSLLLQHRKRFGGHHHIHIRNLSPFGQSKNIPYDMLFEDQYPRKGHETKSAPVHSWGPSHLYVLYPIRISRISVECGPVNATTR